MLRSALSLDRSPFQRSQRAVVLRAVAPSAADRVRRIRAESDLQRFLVRVAAQVRVLDARYAILRAGHSPVEPRAAN